MCADSKIQRATASITLTPARGLQPGNNPSNSTGVQEFHEEIFRRRPTHWTALPHRRYETLRLAGRRVHPGAAFRAVEVLALRKPPTCYALDFGGGARMRMPPNPEPGFQSDESARARFRREVFSKSVLEMPLVGSQWRWPVLREFNPQKTGSLGQGVTQRPGEFRIKYRSRITREHRHQLYYQTPKSVWARKNSSTLPEIFCCNLRAVNRFPVSLSTGLTRYYFLWIA